MDALVGRAARSTVASLFGTVAQICADRVAVVDGDRSVSYRELDERARRLAGVLAARGVGRGDRVAGLSENRLEILELFVAAARLCAVVACQSWRLAAPELLHCVDLVAPQTAFASPAQAGRIPGDVVVFGAAYEKLLAEAPAPPPGAGADVDPEDPLLILYTSGTTGLPKGAVLSHRAQIVRNLVT